MINTLIVGDQRRPHRFDQSPTLEQLPAARHRMQPGRGAGGDFVVRLDGQRGDRSNLIQVDVLSTVEFRHMSPQRLDQVIARKGEGNTALARTILPPAAHP